MSALAIMLVVLAASLFVFLRLAPTLATRARRPPFVVALVLGAVVVAVYEATVFLSDGAARNVWPGVFVQGAAGQAAALLHTSVCAAGAWGLWQLRAWGRWLAMAYLGSLITSFLLWGLRGGDEDVAAIMAWQMFVLPLLTFGFMYLQRGARYFHAARATTR